MLDIIPKLMMMMIIVVVVVDGNHPHPVQGHVTKTCDLSSQDHTSMLKNHMPQEIALLIHRTWRTRRNKTLKKPLLQGIHYHAMGIQAHL